MILRLRESLSLANHEKRSWIELTEFGKFTALRKTPSAVLPEEWRVSHFMPKNGARKTRNHFQTLTVPKTIRPTQTACSFPKNDSVINDSIKLPALTETPLQCAWHKVCSASYVPLIPLPTILPEKHFFPFPF